MFRLSTVLEFENNIGRLCVSDSLDAPPYAEILIQGGIDAAYRHPEYMLVRDIEFLHSLYSNAENMLNKVDWSSKPKWAAAASEGSQGLGRTIVLTCFNLLESFVGGLARAHVMCNANIDEAQATKILSARDSLRKRIISVPRQILGREPSVDINKPPLSLLFGDIKKYRDSFVHCEPGDQVASLGYVKEILFHDISPRLVNDTINYTHAAIRNIWTEIHGRSGPKWLKPHKTTNLVLIPPQ